MTWTEKAATAEIELLKAELLAARGEGKPVVDWSKPIQFRDQSERHDVRVEIVMEGLHSNACPVIVSFLSRITSERDWVYIKGDGCRYPSREAPDDIINVPEVASEPARYIRSRRIRR